MQNNDWVFSIPYAVFGSDTLFIHCLLILRLLLKLDPAPGDFETDTVDIFAFTWVTETALVESTKLLFGLFR